MPFPDDYSTFSTVPASFPDTFSELTDPYLIWTYSNRTLTGVTTATIEQSQYNNLLNTIIGTLSNQITVHDTDIKNELVTLSGGIRQIILAVADSVNTVHTAITTEYGRKVNLII